MDAGASKAADPDFMEFEKLAAYIRLIGTNLLEENFGPRCSEVEPGCECCKRWKALDDLIDNPFAE